MTICATTTRILYRLDLPGGQQGGGLRLGARLQPGEGQGLLPGDRRIRSAEQVNALRRQMASARNAVEKFEKLLEMTTK